MSDEATAQSRIETQVQQIMRALTDRGDLASGPMLERGAKPGDKVTGSAWTRH